MAKGRKCPQCGASMFGQDEEEQPMGSWVTYVCACGFSEKVFEPKR